jgi:hypothetical protein
VRAQDKTPLSSHLKPHLSRRRPQTHEATALPAIADRGDRPSIGAPRPSPPSLTSSPRYLPKQTQRSTIHTHRVTSPFGSRAVHHR